MADQDPRDGHQWEAGWQGHAEAQRARIARLPLREKLRWLEEAQRLVAQLAAQRPAPGDGRSGEGDPERVNR